MVGRDRYGVFPLRGKLLNVRDAAHKQISENAEINAIKQIMGLQHGKSYTDLHSLRYGHLMIMTDQVSLGPYHHVECIPHHMYVSFIATQRLLIC